MATQPNTPTHNERHELIKAFCARDDVSYREALADVRRGRLVAFRFGRRWLRTTETEWRRWLDSKRVRPEE
jgi:hypothetical protein